jgi:hypothetical protein
MRDRAASRPAPAHMPLRVVTAVFALAVCAFACARAIPAAPSVQMSEAMRTQVTAAATAPSPTAKAAHEIAGSDTGMRPGPGSHAPPVATANSECACCAANCCHAATLPVPAQPAAEAWRAHPNAPPAGATASSTRTSPCEPVPRVPSLTELSLLRT